MDTAQVKNCVLQKEAVARKLRRIALEIAEQNAGEQAIIIAAINGNGEVVAEKLVKELKAAADWEVSFTTIQLNKKDPVSVSLQPAIDFEDKVVLIVDDVANSGKTMMYALKPFLTKHPKKVQTVALVERSHKLFPMHTDYTGLSIATTLQEHIVVETKDGEIEGAWLY